MAPVDGDAFIFDDCEEREAGPDARNSSQCGLGYGNHVKIWDGTNIHLLAHLSRVLIPRGRVRKGKVVGIEGLSGAAGPRHVHITVTRPRNGEDPSPLLNTPGHKGSIPVRVRYRVRGEGEVDAGAVWVDELRCSEEQAPRYLAP